MHSINSICPCRNVNEVKTKFASPGVNPEILFSFGLGKLTDLLVVSSLRILIVEDVAGDAELEMRELKRAGIAADARRVETAADFRRELEDFRPHVILADFSMPNFDGMEALRIVSQSHPHIPFIFVSGTLGEEYAVRALKNGATDFVVKNDLLRLPAAVERAIKEAEERHARQRLEQQMRESQLALQEQAAGLQRAQLVAKLAHVITGPGGSFVRVSETLPPLIRPTPPEIPQSTPT